MTKLNTLIALLLVLVSLVVFFIMSQSQLSSQVVEHSIKEAKETSETLTTLDIQTVNKVQSTLYLLQQTIDELQHKQKQLITSNVALKQQIVHLNDISSRPESFSQTDSEAADIDAEENERKFNQHFDDLWVQNGYAEQDEGWAIEIENSVLDIQKQFADADSTTPTITSQYCSVDSCALEFSHQNTTEIERSQFFTEMMPPSASQIIYKKVYEGGMDKTLVIFLK